MDTWQANELVTLIHKYGDERATGTRMDASNTLAKIRAMIDAGGGEGRQRVRCDEDCGAFELPTTTDEIKAALDHWENHPLDRGCSHAR